MDKQILVGYFNHYVALATLIGFIILVLLSIRFMLGNKIKIKIKCYAFDFFSKYALALGFFLTLFGTTLSLIYSDYLGVLPCGLCWFQRIFMYSQVVLFAVAYVKNDIKVFTYSFWLSIIGMIISLYQEWLQLGYSELIPCPAISKFADCAKPTFLSYGFVTFPLAGFVLFGFLMLISLVVARRNK